MVVSNIFYFHPGGGFKYFFKDFHPYLTWGNDPISRTKLEDVFQFDCRHIFRELGGCQPTPLGGQEKTVGFLMFFAGDASIAPVLPSDPPVDPWHVPGFPGATRGLGKVGRFWYHDGGDGRWLI